MKKIVIIIFSVKILLIEIYNQLSLFTYLKYLYEFLLRISSIGPNNLLKLSLVKATTFNLSYDNYIKKNTYTSSNYASCSRSVLY